MVFKTREFAIRRQFGVAAICFWIVQVCLGVPSVFLASVLLTTGKAEGALFSISLFLAWIGCTLAIGVGSLLHGRSQLHLPTVFKVDVYRPDDIPEEYDQEYMGYRFRMLPKGAVEVFTADGPTKYRKWEDFTRAVGR
ncbi:hypothetical protein [Pseudorhodoplanes sp.]|uniref:hypothetical protein n=1 Tax=Pseudorhodoplanes sp. TaxID=1934341 RepID=UPI002CAF7955|nr:hypothetical protein [Pseudorhodoplanes sp.]HWV51327.1 hypothetical protein [Pseudorhodoplanes sp.]